MKTKFHFVIGLLVVGMMFFGAAMTAQASPAPQIAFSTPTPGPDGRIIYVVKSGDNCNLVAALHRISVDQLRANNPSLDQDCNLQVGQQLLIGLGGPAAYTPTPGASPTPTPVSPTPTPFDKGTTEICVLLYDDINGDIIRNAGELGIAGGEVSVINVNGSYTQTQTTVSQLDATDEPIPTCFSGLEEGEYNVSIAVPDGYNATSALNDSVTVVAGDRVYVGFSAQSKEQAPTADPNPEGGNSRTTLLGILGGILLLLGGGLAWWQFRRPRAGTLPPPPIRR
jgi:hypothetical protein